MGKRYRRRRRTLVSSESVKTNQRSLTLPSESVIANISSYFPLFSFSLSLFPPLCRSLSGQFRDQLIFFYLSPRPSESVKISLIIHLHFSSYQQTQHKFTYSSQFFLYAATSSFSRQSVRPSENPLFCIILSTCDSSAIIVTLV